jgi:hypothetical protein
MRHTRNFFAGLAQELAKEEPMNSPMRVSSSAAYLSRLGNTLTFGGLLMLKSSLLDPSPVDMFAPLCSITKYIMNFWDAVLLFGGWAADVP